MRYTRFVVGFDPHGDNQDEEANKAFFKFVDHWKPQIRIAGGDIFDFRAIRRGANAEERRDSMQRDVQEGKLWLEKLKPTHYLRGNHCQRLWDVALLDNGLESDYAKIGVRDIEQLCSKMRCLMYPYNKREGIVRIGHLKVIHGFHAGIYAARRAAQTYGSVLQGHAHSIQHSTIEGLETRMGRVCGCLCKLELEYNRASPGTLSWEHGWAYGVIADDGSYQVWQAQKTGNRWLLPTGLETL